MHRATVSAEGPCVPRRTGLAYSCRMLAGISFFRRAWARSFAGRFGWRTVASLLLCLLVAWSTSRIFGLYVSRHLFLAIGHYEALLHVSRERVAVNPLFDGRPDVQVALAADRNDGYDGQFYLFAAFDPLLLTFRDDPEQYRAVVDHAPYRYGRIGVVWLVRLFEGDHWRHYARGLVRASLWSTGLCALVVALVAWRAGRSPLYGGLVLLIPGFWQSTHLGLPEPLAAALLAAGYLAWRAQWPLTAAVAFASSLLVRETGAILVLCLGAWSFAQGRRREAVGIVTISLFPVVAWRVYVGAVLAPVWGLDAWLRRSGEFSWPLVGITRLWNEVQMGTYVPEAAEVARAALVFPPLLLAATLLGVSSAVRTRAVPAFAGCAYAVLALCLSFDKVWIHVGNAQRVTYELFLMAALITAEGTSGRGGVSRVLTLLLWAFAAAYILWGAFDADEVRRALTFTG